MPDPGPRTASHRGSPPLRARSVARVERLIGFSSVRGRSSAPWRRRTPAGPAACGWSPACSGPARRPRRPRRASGRPRCRCRCAGSARTSAPVLYEVGLDQQPRRVADRGDRLAAAKKDRAKRVASGSRRRKSGLATPPGSMSASKSAAFASCSMTSTGSLVPRSRCSNNWASPSRGHTSAARPPAPVTASQGRSVSDCSAPSAAMRNATFRPVSDTPSKAGGEAVSGGGFICVIGGSFLPTSASSSGARRVPSHARTKRPARTGLAAAPSGHRGRLRTGKELPFAAALPLGGAALTPLVARWSTKALLSV